MCKIVGAMYLQTQSEIILNILTLVKSTNKVEVNIR